MLTRLTFSNSSNNIDIELKQLNKKYKSIDDLMMVVQRDRCSIPEKVDDLKIWQTILSFERELSEIKKQGLELSITPTLSFKEEILFYTSEFFSSLTPRRIEILEYIIINKPDSVKCLAEKTNRDYKNVYDDLIALERVKLIEFVREGKNKRPVSRLTGIDIMFKR